MSFEFGERAQDCLNRNCPAQMEILRYAVEVEGVKEFAEHFGGHMVGEDGEKFDEFIAQSAPEHITEEQIREMQVEVRKLTANGIDAGEALLDGIREVSDGHALSCEGPLKMRGGGFVISICTSRRLYNQGEWNLGNANIKPE
ncbi:MAG: hypothetical protein M3P98_04165 [bacterium]|nr:hypothetical protein [bacterium]